MSGGHSVIQNSCRYIFIYSFCATPLNRHGYNLKGFRQTFICSQHTNVNLRVNYDCIEPFLFKRENENGVTGAGVPRWCEAPVEPCTLARAQAGSHATAAPAPTGGHSAAVRTEARWLP